MASSVCWNNLPSVVLLEIFKMISHEERIRASSACKEWRKAFFFPNFWRDLCIDMYSKNDKYAIERCQFFTSSFISALRNLKIIFTYENNYLSQVSKVLSELSGNRQVKKLFLYGFEEPNLNLILSLCGCAVKLINFLENVKSINSLHISHVWFSLRNNDFRLALEKHKESLQNLGIGGVFYGDQQNEVLDLPVDFSVFKHLAVLSLDHVWLTDEALKEICDLKLLKRLIVLLDKEFRGRRIRNESWECFHKSLPECELRVNLIKGITKDVMRIFSKRMPVTHIKVLYCDGVDLSLMSMFSSFKDLRSVWCLAERELTLPPEQNPLVICAWTCRKLEELIIIEERIRTLLVCPLVFFSEKNANSKPVFSPSVIPSPRDFSSILSPTLRETVENSSCTNGGFQFDYEDLVGIARLRGSKLKKLEITQADVVKLFVTDSMHSWESRTLFPIEMNMFTEMMSKALDRNWSPVDVAAYNQSKLSPYENKINNIVEILSKDYEL